MKHWFDTFMIPPASTTIGPESRRSPLHEYPAWCGGEDVPGGSNLAARLVRVTLAAARGPDTAGQVAGLRALLGLAHYLPVDAVAALVRAVQDGSTAIWSARLAVRWASVQTSPGEDRRTVQQELWCRGAALGVCDPQYWRLVGLL